MRARQIRSADWWPVADCAGVNDTISAAMRMCCERPAPISVWGDLDRPFRDKAGTAVDDGDRVAVCKHLLADAVELFDQGVTIVNGAIEVTVGIVTLTA